MRLGDHVLVIGAITNCQSQVWSGFLDIPDKFLLLVGNATVADGLVQRQLGREPATRVKGVDNITSGLLFEYVPFSPILFLICFIILRYFDDLRVLPDHATRPSYVNGSLSLVACQYEELNAELF